MKFNDLTLNDHALIAKRLQKNNVGWEYNFATLFLWNGNGRMKIAHTKDVTIVYARFSDSPVFLPPYCDDEHFLEAISLMREEARNMGVKCRIRGLTKTQADKIKDDFNLSTNRDDYDYVYDAESLINLKGKAFHSKRNFVSRFCAKYPDYRLVEYEKNEYGSVFSLLNLWSEQASAHKTLEWERRAIMTALEHYEELNLKIALLKVGDQCVAFSISAIEQNGVAHTIFEKANIAFDGAYPTINKLTANKFFTPNMLVNRQEDMGIEGLRKAKLSYSPLFLVEKYLAEEK